ncbi:uncharacterized protein [Miscanthus floridulus]|uniref:uncharacterized protein n=1 Tax=Miscanthus floridulus TaxID=154761 RepID=UPI003458C462
MRSSKERLSKGVFSHAETVGAPVSYQRRDALEELEEASDPHKEELNEVDAPKQDQDEDVVIIEDEKLMEETSAEEPSVTNQECTDKSEMQEHQLDDEECHAPLATPEQQWWFAKSQCQPQQNRDGRKRQFLRLLS